MKRICVLVLAIALMTCCLLSGCKKSQDAAGGTAGPGSQAPVSTDSAATNDPAATNNPATPTDPAAPTDPAEQPATPTAVPTEEPTAAPTATEKPDYSGGIVSDAHVDVPLYPDLNAADLKAQSGTGITIGLQFYATAPFYGIGIHSPTWTATEGYSVDYVLYEWQADYYDTIGSAPVVEISTAGWRDGSCAQVIFENDLELPAGEYLLIAKYQSTMPLHNGGVYYIEQESEWTRAYKNDVLWEGVTIITTVFYSKTPANLHGPISDSGIE